MYTYLCYRKKCEVVKTRFLTVIKVMFLVIFIFHTYSITFFPHRHSIEGVEIIHSHPYKKDCHKQPMHSHSWAEITTIQELTKILTTGLFQGFVWEIISQTYIQIEPQATNLTVFFEEAKSLKLRAPPIISLL